MQLKPRYYQDAANKAVWQYLRQQDGNPLIVLPTGAGKSIVIAMLVKQALAYSGRVIVLQHRKELISQNAEKIGMLLPGVEIGINSAGLRRHAFDSDVICAGIQTVYRKALEFGRRELIIIDEAHLIGQSDDSMYGQFIADLMRVNPKLRVVGLTATPYRTGEGPICGRKKLFNRIAYECQTGDLIREGYLCPVTNRVATATVETGAINTHGGEFIAGEMERAFDVDDIVLAACSEIVEKCHDRRSVLLFAAGVTHAEHVASALQQITGETICIVTGDTFAMEREKHLSDFRRQQLRWLVNCDVLTTGFDAPCVDAIPVLRATMSSGLFAQIVGRGLRKHDAKRDCLILDFGGNIKRHGSLDDPNYGRASVGSGGSGKASPADQNGRGKTCPNCEQDVAANARECPECGLMFPVNHEAQADQESAITGAPEPEVWEVVGWDVSVHQKKGNPNALPTMRFDYQCQPIDAEERGNLTTKHVSEWVCFDHTGFARTKAGLWWQARSGFSEPESVEDAVDMVRRGVCRCPNTITTIREGKYVRVQSVTFADDKPEEMLEPSESVEVIEFSGVGDDVPF